MNDNRLYIAIGIFHKKNYKDIVTCVKGFVILSYALMERESPTVFL